MFMRYFSAVLYRTYEGCGVSDGQHVPDDGGEDGDGQHDGHACTVKCGFVTLCDNQDPDVMMFPGEPTISGQSLITRDETLRHWDTETLTQWQLLPGVRGEREAQHRHGGDQEAGHDQVGEVVQRPPPDLDGEGDVEIRLRAAIIDHLVPDGGDAWRIKLWWGISNVAWNFERREFDI